MMPLPSPALCCHRVKKNLSIFYKWKNMLLWSRHLPSESIPLHPLFLHFLHKKSFPGQMCAFFSLVSLCWFPGSVSRILMACCDIHWKVLNHIHFSCVFVSIISKGDTYYLPTLRQLSEVLSCLSWCFKIKRNLPLLLPNSWPIYNAGINVCLYHLFLVFS